MIESLDVAACWDLLRTRQLGRLAFTDRALPAIRPLNYCVDGTHLVLRTGSELTRRLDGQVVAFEVDDIDDDQHAGASVVVTGTLRAAVGSEWVRTATAPPSWAGEENQHALRLTVGELQGRRIVAAAPVGGTA